MCIARTVLVAFPFSPRERNAYLERSPNFVRGIWKAFTQSRDKGKTRERERPQGGVV